MEAMQPRYQNSSSSSSQRVGEVLWLSDRKRQNSKSSLCSTSKNDCETTLKLEREATETDRLAVQPILSVVACAALGLNYCSHPLLRKTEKEKACAVRDGLG